MLANLEVKKFYLKVRKHLALEYERTRKPRESPFVLQGLVARGGYQEGSTVLAYHCQVESCAKPAEANRRCAGSFDSDVSR